MIVLPSLSDLKKQPYSDAEILAVGQQAMSVTAFDIAEFCFRTLASQSNLTTSTPIQAYLDCLVQQYKYDAALRFVNRHMKKGKAVAFFRNWRARLHILTHNFPLAERDLLQLLKDNPESAALHRNLALLYRDFDIRDKAAIFYEKTLLLNGNDGEAFRLLTSLQHYDSRPVIAQSIEADMMAGKCNHPDFWFGLGKIYDDLGDIDQAWNCFKRGNQQVNLDGKPSIGAMLQAATSWRDAVLDYVKINGPDRGEREINSNPLIWISGFPRSGTTLLEHVLSSHQPFQPCGELTITATAEAALRNRQPQLGSKLRIDASKAHMFAQTYTGLLHNIAQKKRIPVDKAINLFKYTGLMLPQSPDMRVVQIKRSVKDLVLSNFQSRFLTDQFWSFDIAHILQWLAFALESMNIWQDLFPDQVMTMTYDDYVLDPDTYHDRLADFLTLNKTRPDFAFKGHQKRAVMTATANQLGDAVHQSSRGKADAYAQYLEPWAADFDRLERLG